MVQIIFKRNLYKTVVGHGGFVLKDRADLVGMCSYIRHTRKSPLAVESAVDNIKG